VSEEKKQKKTTFVQIQSTKKKPPQTGNSFLHIIPFRRLSQLVLATSLPGAFFSSVSEEKKQKKTAFVQIQSTKKKPPQTGGPFLHIVPFRRLSQLVPATSLPGAFFSSVSEEKKQKKTAFVQIQSTKKETTANRQFLPAHNTFIHIRFSGGCGRGLFPGKSLLPPAPLKPIPGAFPAGSLLFFCVRRKEAKEDHICSNTIHKKETTANRQFLPAHNIFSPYTLFGRVREGAFPGEKPSPALPPLTSTPANLARHPIILPVRLISSLRSSSTV